MQRAVEIQNRGLALRGTLHVPENISGKVPAVCLFHGFTANRTEHHFLFVKMSRTLEKQGIASVRFDFAGSGESDGLFRDMTITGELSDARAILEYTRGLDFVDTQKIGVLGLSLGGAVAALLSAEAAAKIKALCLWAPAVCIGDIVGARSNGTQLSSLKDRGFYDYFGYELGIGFLKETQTLDLYAKSAGFNKNVLILHGSNDQTVPLYASEKMQEVYGDQSKLRVIEGSGHTFNGVEWEREAIERTAGFFVKEFS